jgi:hypothetical protein
VAADAVQRRPDHQPQQNDTMTTDLSKILEERGKRYGCFKDHAAVTMKLKLIARGHLCDHRVYLAHDQEEALDMIFHKIGRILNGDPNYADSWDDIAGYAKLVADRLHTEQQQTPS